MVKHIKSVEEFEQEIKTGLKVVDFFATWCGPCRLLSPVLEEYSEEHPDVDILKIDCDEVSELASKYFVNSIPYIITFVDGVKTGENVGYLPKPQLDRFLNSSLKI